MICQAAQVGVPLVDARVFITNRPCLRCSLALIQCRVREVVFEGAYISEKGRLDQVEMFRAAGIPFLEYRGGQLWQM